MNSRSLGNILNKYRKQINRIGLKQFFKYYYPFGKKIVSIKIGKHSLFVRKNSSDLKVAIKCLAEKEFVLLSRIFSQDHNGIIIDAGANIGASVLALSDYYPNAKIIAIEPERNNLSILKKNLKDHYNVEIIDKALASKSGNLVYLHDRGTGRHGFTIAKSDNPNSSSMATDEVKTINLESLVKDISKVSILKIDIEGGENDLFINDSKTLNKVKIIFVELHDRIVRDCSNNFFEFSKNRVVIKGDSEKFLSIKTK